VRMSGLSCGAKTRCARRRLVLRGGDSSCVAETARARRRLVVRGGDCSEGGPSSGELVGDAPNCSGIGHLASDGLDRGHQSSSS
jgi:hypothetical protein